MLITHVTEISLTKEQITRCKEILFLCTKIWNKYIEVANDYAKRGQLIPNKYVFDKMYQNYKAEDPSWARLPSKARTDTIKRCWERSILGNIKDGIWEFKYKSYHKNPVTSFFFMKECTRFIDDRHIWICDIHSIKIREKGYICPELLPYITSGRIIYDRPRDKWFIMVILDVPNDFGRRPLYKDAPIHDGIGIDLGVSTLMTLYSERYRGKYQFLDNTDNVCLNDHCRAIENKIAELDRIIDHKIQWNKVAAGFKRHENVKNIPVELRQSIYHTKRIDKLRRRINKLYGQLTRYRNDCIKKMCNALVRLQPEFICMEDLDVTSLRLKNKNKAFHRHISSSKWRYIRDTIQWQCQHYDVRFITDDPFRPSSQLCSECFSIQPMPTHIRVYDCPVCGLRIDRDINAAKNLYQYGYAKCPKVFESNDFKILGYEDR